ncbi:MAG: RHS repeat-associated core domain-containing protein [Gemmataceae bacterium]
MYNPNLGRWLTQDPIGFDAGDQNIYRYVGNSPTNLVDPSGLAAAPPADEYIKIRPGPPRPGRPYPPPADFYLSLATYEFSGVSFTHNGLKCRGDVSVNVRAERRFKDGLLENDKVPSNFATFLLVVKEYTNVKCEIDCKWKNADNFTTQYGLGVRLIGVFIAPTIRTYADSFKPGSFETFDADFVAGLLTLPSGHPSDKKKP